MGINFLGLHGNSAHFLVFFSSLSKHKLHKGELLFVCVLFLTFSYFYQGGGANPASRFDLSLAITFEGRFAIDSYHNNTVDKVLVNGHYFTEKAPLTSYLALPVPWIASYFTTSKELFERPMIADILLYLSAILSVSLISALSAVAFSRTLLILNPSLETQQSHLITFLFYIGTLIFPYSTALFGHQLAAAFMVFGLFFGLRALDRVAGPRQDYFLSSLFLSLAVATEYPVLVSAGILFFTTGWSARKKQEFLLSLVAPLISIVILLVHNYLSFGSPFALGYGKLQGTAFESGMSRGFLGIQLPDLGNIAQLLFGAYRGLFVYCPVLFIGAVGYFY